MKNNVFTSICAFLLAIALLISSVSSFQIIRAYAGEYEESQESIAVEEETVTPDQQEQESQADPEPEPEPESEPDYQPDPFDYNLVCYTPNINFGSVTQGSQVAQKTFTITNIGNNAFPLTWDTYDPNNAFVVEAPMITSLNKEESLNFMVAPGNSLAPGTYSASLVFYSANDIRQHHTATVTFTVTVEKQAPYISSVSVTPGSISLPVGKSYQFSASVTGGNNYDTAVTWSVIGNRSSKTTISGGNLQIASDETASTLTVVATSNQDTSKYGASTVSISQVDHVISISVTPSGSGAIAGAGSVRDGSNAGLTASPNNNYRFVGWYENGNILSSNKQYTLTNITSDHNLTAKFERISCYVKTSVNNTDGGTVTGSSSVNYNGNYTITAKAKSGYYFEGFVENNKTISTASSIQLNNITSDRNITAVFKKSQYNVNVSVNPSDTGKYEGAGRYDRDSKVRLRATAYDGYVFTGWTINGQVVSRDSEYEISKITNDVNVVANFMKKEAKTYKLTSSITNSGGGIVPSGDYTAPEGSSVTYNIVPQANYRISAVTVDGKNIGAIASYTFNNIHEAHTIKATFEPIPAAPKTNNSNSSTTKTTVKPKTTTTPAPVEYNSETAAKGAMPEQKVTSETPSDEVETLDEDQYADDTFSIADEQVATAASAESNGVISKYGLDEETVKQLIHDRAALPMLREAFNDGYLQITVNNSYAQDTQETAVALYYQDPTLLNFENVIAETLSEDEQLAVLKGAPVSFNVDITDNTDTIDKDTKAHMQKTIGYKPICYFDFQIMKTSNGTSDIISTTNSELEVKIPIPETYQKEGRKFYIIREHEGNVEILQDIGNDPTSITFKTDKFSEYAIAYETVNVNQLILQFSIILLISLLVAMICFVALIKHRRHQRRMRRSSSRR